MKTWQLLLLTSCLALTSNVYAQNSKDPAEDTTASQDSQVKPETELSDSNDGVPNNEQLSDSSDPGVVDSTPIKPDPVLVNDGDNSADTTTPSDPDVPVVTDVKPIDPSMLERGDTAVPVLYTSLPMTTANTPTSVPPKIDANLAIINAFYDLLNSHDDASLEQRATAVIAPNWFANPKPLGGQGLKGFVKTFSQYHQAIPDMKWTPKKIYKSGHFYTVRSIGQGTPVFDFLHIGAKQGNHFTISTIDIHKIVKGKIVRTYHVEDWNTAREQLLSQGARSK